MDREEWSRVFLIVMAVAMLAFAGYKAEIADREPGIVVYREDGTCVTNRPINWWRVAFEAMVEVLEAVATEGGDYDD